MSNSLTGDFEAVLEVSGGTWDRLLASMHQNGYTDPSRPSLPHISYFRIGGSAGDGPRGSVAAQIGVPHVALIDGASDRFGLEFGLRARYRADPGSAPLANVIHGTVRAEYRFQDIDRHCAGWRGLADQYLWLRVVEDSVSFEGTVYNPPSDGVGPVVNENAVNAQITQQLALLLETQFVPKPQPIGPRFRNGLRCLVSGPGPNESAVAIPIGLSNDTPAGDPASIGELFLGQSDFALAISSDYIIASVQPQLDPMVGLQRNLHVHGDAGWEGGLEIDYHVRLDSIEAQWLGTFVTAFFPDSDQSMGVIRIAFGGSGWATYLYTSGIYNLASINIDDLRMTFSGEQFLTLKFDSGSERVLISALGPPSVSVNYGGPYGENVIPLGQSTIVAQVQANLGGPLGQAQQQLDALTGPSQKSPMVDQLTQIDGAASARFDEAAFVREGMILRGTIGLSGRNAPQVTFAKTPAGDGFTAIESWIPGGRVDSFEWSWNWGTNPIQPPAGPAGSEFETHDFLLRRTHRRETKFRMSLFGDKPLPGIDGVGSVCLIIKGVHVDPRTGILVPVEAVTHCELFGYQFQIPIELAPLVAWFDPSAAPEEGPYTEIGMMQVGVSPSAANTLVLAVGAEWNPELASVLTGGLKACRRVNAGLLVLLLFQEGALSEAGPKLGAELKALAANLEAPMLATEDLQQGWSNALGLPTGMGKPMWRLIAPDGIVAWAKSGLAQAKELASVLDEQLVVSQPATPGSVQPGVRRGYQVPNPLGGSPGYQVPNPLGGPPCPPVPLSRPGSVGTTLVFAQKDHTTSLKQLEKVGHEHSKRLAAQDGLAVRQGSAATKSTPGNRFVAAVLTGASSGDAERLQAKLKLDFPIFPDPTGILTRHAGVHFWPTTLTLDNRGRITDVRMPFKVAKAPSR